MQTPIEPFDAIVERYREPLTRAAHHLCSNREAADDIVQETLVDAYRGYTGLRDPASVGPWLYTILRRKAAGYRQTRKPEVELTEAIAGVQTDGTSLVKQVMAEQLAKLKREDREILAGRYLIGLSYRELAEALGIKEGAVRVRCLRAKLRLGEILRSAGMRVPEKEGKL
jgi:RNA polymerase sigma-70 factor, ECF subfamily